MHSTSKKKRKQFNTTHYPLLLCNLLIAGWVSANETNSTHHLVAITFSASPASPMRAGKEIVRQQQLPHVMSVTISSLTPSYTLFLLIAISYPLQGIIRYNTFHIQIKLRRSQRNTLPIKLTLTKSILLSTVKVHSSIFHPFPSAVVD